MKKLLLLTMFLAANAFAGPKITPQFKHVELKEFTSMQLSILPDAGTQLIFPFELDNPDLTPTLKIRLTNKNGFDVPTDGESIKALLKGQNTISILGVPNANNPGAEYVSNLFINIGGYNLSIALKTTYDTTEHVSNIIFNVDDKTREHMIESAVKRKTKELEKEHKEKLAKIDQEAKKQSLKHIAVMARQSPSSTNYKESENIIIDKNRIQLFADKLTEFGEYKVLLFEVANKSSGDFTIENLSLIAKKEGDIEEKINGSFNCESRLNADSTNYCSFSTLSHTIKEALRLELKISTDRGQGAMSW